MYHATYITLHLYKNLKKELILGSRLVECFIAFSFPLVTVGVAAFAANNSNRNSKVVTHVHEEVHKPAGPCFLTVSLDFAPLFHKAFQGNSLSLT